MCVCVCVCVCVCFISNIDMKSYYSFIVIPIVLKIMDILYRSPLINNIVIKNFSENVFYVNKHIIYISLKCWLNLTNTQTSKDQITFLKLIVK